MSKSNRLSRLIAKPGALGGLALALALAAPGASAQAQAQTTGDGRYELVVPTGKSEVLELPAAYSDVMVANPEIADVLPLSNRSVYVVGKKLGSTAISIYGPGKRLLTSVSVVVSADVGG